MPTSTSVRVENPVSHYGDKIVRRVDGFPELLLALRDGDRLSGRLFCAQLFDFDARQSVRAGGTGSAVSKSF